MTQIPLLNYQILSKTKAVKFAQRARANATTSSKSEMIAASNSPAGHAEQPAKALNTSPASSPARLTKCHKAGLGTTEAEFNLPDEDRVLTVLLAHSRCVKCGAKPQLERQDSKFRVRCPPAYFDYQIYGQQCPQPTPWLDSSAAAIRVWTITQKLTQL